MTVFEEYYHALKSIFLRFISFLRSKRQAIKKSQKALP